MIVSPNAGGDVKVDDNIQKTESETYTCGTGLTVKLQAIPAQYYKFDRWGGSLSGNTNPTSIGTDAAHVVTAYFVPITEPVNLNQAKTKLDENLNWIIIDIREATNFSKGHILCARNYIWNAAGNNFTSGISGLTAYKNNNIFIYGQNTSNAEDAATFLAGQGFHSVYYMTDVFDDWLAEGYESVSSSEDNGICTSLAPMAYAGSDQTVSENVTVKLHGYGSDPDGGTVSYLWDQVQGTTSLSNPNIASPTFTSPVLNGSDEEFIFHLTVTDDEGDKDTDSVTITISFENNPPTADAGPDQTVKPGVNVSLDGSNSYDPENASLSYSWMPVKGNLGLIPLTKSNTATPSFTAPDKNGYVDFQLTVTDNGGLTDTATIRITVQTEVVDTNDPPEANAGSDQTVTEGQTVILDSSASTDADGSIASREWTQTGGIPTVTLPNPAAIKPVFTAPDVSAPTVLTFMLTVTDNEGATDTDTITVTVNDDSTPPPKQNVAPSADAGEDQSVKEGVTVVLDSTGSTDADGTIASRIWNQTGGTPAVILSNSGAIKPTFTAPDVDSSTVLTFSLVVTDDEGATSSADTVQVTITKSSGGGGGGGCFINSLAD